MFQKKKNSPHIPFQHYPRSPDLEMQFRICLGQGIFERASFENFMNHVEGRDSVIEVGAHVGSWTIGFSQLFRKVLAFEPQPTNRSYLFNNLARGKVLNTQVFAAAVVNEPSNDLYISPTGSTRNSGMAFVSRNYEDNKGIRVAGVRLDEALSNREETGIGHVDAIKIDVEGFELDVIKSGSDIISRDKPVILLEINRHCARAGTTKDGVISHMAQMGYQVASKRRNDYIFVPK